jgi:t-SNARE complex subunit (syntaxin)
VELSTAFEQIAKVTIKDEITRRSSQPVRPASSSSSSSSSQYNNNQPTSPPLQQQAIIQNDRDVEQQIIVEKNKVRRSGGENNFNLLIPYQEMQALEEELKDINAIFTDLKNLTVQQGEELKVAQTNTETSVTNVEAGKGQLELVCVFSRALLSHLVK